MPVHIGRTLGFTELTAHGRTADAVTLQIRDAVERTGAVSLMASEPPADQRQPSAPAVDPEALERDVRRLPPAAGLITAGALHVYCAKAAQIPHVLAEIGRLRELCFRAVGEGTGKPLDIDVFDEQYLHLFLWNQQSREVIGAYRIGRTDSIVASAGVEGLYTRTLFRYDKTLFDRLPPALELGRSFVQSEHQRDHNALLLLWKGICAFVQRHPRYRVLFGAVRISAQYTDRTREMLMRFLEQNHLHPALAERISALCPYAPSHPQTATTGVVRGPSGTTTPVPPSDHESVARGQVANLAPPALKGSCSRKAGWPEYGTWTRLRPRRRGCLDSTR